jgi:hypothetical protein
MKVYRGVQVQLHTFLATALEGGEWSTSCPSCINPSERVPGTPWIGGWVGPRTGLEDTIVVVNLNSA